MLLEQLKESFFGYLNQLEKTDLNLLFDNIVTFVDDFKQKQTESNQTSAPESSLPAPVLPEINHNTNGTSELVVQPNNETQTNPISDRATVSSKYDESIHIDSEAENFNEEQLENLIQINENEM